MSHLVLSTVGTTTIENRQFVDNLVDGRLRAWAQTGEKNFIEDQPLARKLGDEIAKVWPHIQKTLTIVPAEIASLARIRAHFGIQERDGSRFVFISSQTPRGKSCTWAVMHAFRQIFHPCDCSTDSLGACAHVDFHCLEGVQAKDYRRFTEGANGLAGLIAAERKSFTAANGDLRERLIFNYTGSYKGLIPFATEACHEQQFIMAYLFEGAPFLFFKRPDSARIVPEDRLFVPGL